MEKGSTEESEKSFSRRETVDRPIAMCRKIKEGLRGRGVGNKLGGAE